MEELNTDLKYYVGIDLGATTTDIGITDTKGEIVARGTISTRTHTDVHRYADDLYKETEELAKVVGGIENVAAIGIGAPGANREGEIAYSKNLPWEMPVPLAAIVEKRFGIPVTVDNDANAAAAGEMIYGVARGMRNFITITLGTGVGSGIVCDGKLLRGHRGMGGELGHLSVRHTNARACTCGKNGCLEAYCSASGMVRTAKEWLADNPMRDTLLRTMASESITALDVYDAAIKGDVFAREIFDFTGEMLGEALAEFMNISDPEAFVLFGGLARSGELLLTPVKDSFRRHLMPLWRRYETKILLSTLPGADAAVLGAAALAADN